MTALSLESVESVRGQARHKPAAASFSLPPVVRPVNSSFLVVTGTHFAAPVLSSKVVFVLKELQFLTLRICFPRISRHSDDRQKSDETTPRTTGPPLVNAEYPLVMFHETVAPAVATTAL